MFYKPFETEETIHFLEELLWASLEAVVWPNQK